MNKKQDMSWVGSHTDHDEENVQAHSRAEETPEPNLEAGGALSDAACSDSSLPVKYGTPEWYALKEERQFETALKGRQEMLALRLRGVEVLRDATLGLPLEDRKALIALLRW